jgi:AraC-like DNA-binding protein
MVSAIMVRALADGVGHIGLSMEELFHGTAVKAEIMASPHGFVDERDFHALCARAVRMSRDPAFGLHWSERSTFAPFDLVGHLVVSLPTLGDALTSVVQLMPLLTSGNRVDLVETSTSAELRCVFAIPAEAPTCHVREEFIAGAVARLLRLYAGAGGLPSAVHFTYPEPAQRCEYERVFGKVVRYGQPSCSIVFDRSLLAGKLPYSDVSLSSLLRSSADARLRQITGAHSLAARLRETLNALPPTDWGTMDEVAARMGHSGRALRRHLAAESTSYPAISAEILRAHAERLLVDPRCSIKEVAMAVGFSDPSSFHRAFQRWAGMTPAKYRVSRRQR